MLSLLLIPITAFLNRVRGGMLNVPAGRIISALVLGIIAGLLATSVTVGAGVAIGYYLWALPGWGLYFAAANGQWREGEVEVAFIDRIGLRLIPFVTPQEDTSNYRRGILCMGLRGGIFALPLFAFLAAANWWAICVWPIFFLQGVAYYIAGRITGNQKDPIALAEWLWGAVIGATLSLSLNLI